MTPNADHIRAAWAMYDGAMNAQKLPPKPVNVKLIEALERLLSCSMHDPMRGRPGAGRRYTINAKVFDVEFARGVLDAAKSGVLPEHELDFLLTTGLPHLSMPDLVKRVRYTSMIMEMTGGLLEYYGGLSEIAQHGQEMIGAAVIAREWADQIEQMGGEE